MDADVQFEYPWLPSKCTLCSKWGHIAKACGGKGKNIRILQTKVPTEKKGATDKTCVSEASESVTNGVMESEEVVGEKETTEQLFNEEVLAETDTMPVDTRSKDESIKEKVTEVEAEKSEPKQ